MLGDFADPFVIRVEDAYYAFATGTRANHLQLARSTDLSSWTALSDPLPRLAVWASTEPGLTWAPSVLARPNGYVLYYTTRDRASGFQCISRARAERAEGPYVDETARPWICQTASCGSIDPSPYVAADGVRLLWKSDANSDACKGTPKIWSQRLSDDGLELVGNPTALITLDAPWEGTIVEGPSMLSHDGKHVLLYSANWYDSDRYAIGWASCATPEGPCTKAPAPMFGSRGAILGPGGQEIFSDRDGKTWLAFHAWSMPHSSYAAGGARSLRIAPLEFDGDTPIVRE